MIKITVELPKTKFAKKKWLDSIASAQRRNSVPQLRKLFNQTTTGWSKKPRMGYSQQKSASEISLFVYPTGERSDVWSIINEGQPKKIKHSKTLMVFKRGYRASTKPGSLQSRRAYRSNPVWTARKINHGIEARKFTELIAQEFASEFGMQMQEAVSEVANSK